MTRNELYDFLNCDIYELNNNECFWYESSDGGYCLKVNNDFKNDSYRICYYDGVCYGDNVFICTDFIIDICSEYTENNQKHIDTIINVYQYECDGDNTLLSPKKHILCSHCATIDNLIQIIKLSL